ncbi:MAG TPA: hypothetical protein VNO50_20445 [Pyrinomonadaceae bacterium]|nr:hypothetical protein [Pyrinomonadaceae bacterium]
MRGTTTLKQLQQDLLTEVGDEARQFGFKLNKTYYSFRRKTTFGWQAFGISPVVHPEIDFDITVNVSIGFEALTELFNKYDSTRDAEQKRNGKFNFGAELGNIAEGRPKRYTVTTSADITPVTHAVISDLTLFGFPYLAKYSTLESVLEDIVADDESWTAFLLMPFHDVRAKSAIGIAYLLGQQERFKEIAVSKEAYLISMKAPEFQLESFRKFRDELEVLFGREEKPDTAK